LRIALASDHAGFELKELLEEELQRSGHEVVDHGTHDATPRRRATIPMPPRPSAAPS
jgi:ribose 5-phosphate isomerase RpiB